MLQVLLLLLHVSHPGFNSAMSRFKLLQIDMLSHRG